MSKNPLKLKIAYLYPEILQGFCDKANVDAFCLRAKWRNIETSIQTIGINDKITSSKYDFFYIGGSDISLMPHIIKYLKQNEKELKNGAESGIPMLAVGCGYIMFGNYWQLHNSKKISGIKILDTYSIAGKKLWANKVFGTCHILNNKVVAGYTNHSMVTYLNKNVSPFIKLQYGMGNNEKSKYEGARFNNVIGTYITSALLPQNPHLSDYLLNSALNIKYRCKIPLAPLCDDLEQFSHKYITDSK